jgi:hypothetical protein
MKLGATLLLAELAETFSDYREQNELSQHIAERATANDVDLLLDLNRKTKLEQVVQASQSALIRLIDPNDGATLDKMSKSRHPNTAAAFERVALSMGHRLPLKTLRDGLRAKKTWSRLLSIYALAEKGDSQDFTALKGILKTKVSDKIKRALFKTMVRMEVRAVSHGGMSVLEDYLPKSDSLVVCDPIWFIPISLPQSTALDPDKIVAALEVLDANCEFQDIDRLILYYPYYPDLVSTAIYNNFGSSHVRKLRTLLRRMPFEPSSRELVYALCKHGAKNDFSFLFNLFLHYGQAIRVRNPHDVVNRIAALATRSHLPLLKKVLDTTDFWDYYKTSSAPEPSIPVASYENKYLMQRLAASAFGRVARRSEIATVYRMLGHKYWVIWHPALYAIRRHGNVRDLKNLLEIASTSTSSTDGQIAAICLLDEKIYPLTDKAPSGK